VYSSPKKFCENKSGSCDNTSLCCSWPWDFVHWTAVKKQSATEIGHAHMKCSEWFRKGAFYALLLLAWTVRHSPDWHYCRLASGHVTKFSQPLQPSANTRRESVSSKRFLFPKSNIFKSCANMIFALKFKNDELGVFRTGTSLQNHYLYIYWSHKSRFK